MQAALLAAAQWTEVTSAFLKDACSSPWNADLNAIIAMAPSAMDAALLPEKHVIHRVVRSHLHVPKDASHARKKEG